MVDLRSLQSWKHGAFAMLGQEHVASLGVAERPNLVALDRLARQPAQRPVLVLRARGAQVHEQLRDRVLRRARDPDGRADAVALDQMPQDRVPLLNLHYVRHFKPAFCIAAGSA
jgi:hypothetical protein